MTDPYVDDLIRTFYALSAPSGLVDSVRRFQGRARIDLPRGLRWTKPDQVHLTLAFLGHVPVERIEELKQITQSVATGFQGFDAIVQGVGGFPRADRPRVIWAGLSGESHLKFGDLHHRIWDRLNSEIPKPAPLGREFHPHLTLARVSGPQPPGIAEWMKQNSEFGFGVWPVRELVLLQSVLTPNGPIYQTLAQAQLGI